MNATIGPDFDLVIMMNIFQGKLISPEAVSSRMNNMTQLTVVNASDPFNFEFEKKTDRKVIWISQCTQLNFLAAIEKKAAIIGFANEKVNPTQVFNCHKLLTENAGVPMTLAEIDEGGVVSTVSKVL